MQLVLVLLKNNTYLLLSFFTDVCLVTTVKPETVSVYQVKKTEKDTYKKRMNWRLKDLRLIDGRDEANVRTSKKRKWLLPMIHNSVNDLIVSLNLLLTHYCKLYM